jgi:RNA polymerase sigma-70 factor (ECF subfamily)
MRSRSRALEQELLYRTYARELWGFALYQLRDRALAEEVVEAVFERAFREPPPDGRSQHAWLLELAREAVAEVDVRPRHPAPATPVGRAFARLSREHREVLGLGHFGGLKVHEIADLVDIPPEVVKRRTYFALRSLRLALEELET